MATKLKRGKTWQYKFRRKALFNGQKCFTFDSEAEGDEFAEKAEALLSAGIVPPGFVSDNRGVDNLRAMIDGYLESVCIKEDCVLKLRTIRRDCGDALLSEIVSYSWVEAWVSSLKLIKNLAPSTIRKYKGSLDGCFRWGVGKQFLPLNPLSLLPKNYAEYTKADSDCIEARMDKQRDRRLMQNEEERVRKVLNGYNYECIGRSTRVKQMAAKKCIFDLALESAMRMREMYTLTYQQIDIPNRTVFLDKTKNGSKRQVPLTTVAIKCLNDYFQKVRDGEDGMSDFTIDADGLIFPWWDGSDENLKRTTVNLSKAWSKVFEIAKVDDFKFHDLRHEATSRFFERSNMSAFKIAKITGHKNMSMLDRYANLRASDLANELW